MNADEPLAAPRFSVVVPAHNEAEHIEACLGALTALDASPGDVEVIVVDNGSTDDTRERAARFPVRLLDLPSGRVGAVRNHGARQARGDVVAFVDADCEVPTDWLTCADALLREHGPDVVLGGGALLPPGADWIERDWLLEGPRGQGLPVDLIGASIVCPREVFDGLGGFDETVTSGEDSHLSLTARARGVRVLIDPQLSVIHHGNARTLRDFMRRQAWHAENYAATLGRSLGDPVFLLVGAFLTAVCASPLLLAVRPALLPLALLVIAGAPAILSAKRILRARPPSLPPARLARIYLLDLCYLTGRSLGLLRGIVRRDSRR